MGKASRWIRNLLIGKKDDKISNKDISPSSATAIIPLTPGRRWSFRRSNSTEKVLNHKCCRSLDSIVASQLVSHALFDYAVHHQPPPKATTKTVNGGSRMIAVASATKIQSAFRSYLARKALCALRGLVKLQAVVRGHLVRKRTTTMVRCMKALVSIQVRARYQRIQLVEDAELRSHTRRGSATAHKRRPGSPQYDHNEINGHFGGKTSTCISYRQSSRRFSIDSLPSTHDKSMRSHDKLIDEVSTTMSQLNTEHVEPNYMTRTKSSTAKARSHSEPRQRLSKQKREHRQNEGLGAVMNGVRTHDHKKNHEVWLAKLHRSSKSSSDFDFDSASSCTNGSSYNTTLHECKTDKSLY